MCFSDFEWDFDVMLRKKKEENRRQRKRRRDGSIDLLSDADDQIKEMIDAMKQAAKVGFFSLLRESSFSHESIFHMN